jgi:hypothetical protein
MIRCRAHSGPGELIVGAGFPFAVNGHRGPHRLRSSTYAGFGRFAPAIRSDGRGGNRPREHRAEPEADSPLLNWGNIGEPRS